MFWFSCRYGLKLRPGFYQFCSLSSITTLSYQQKCLGNNIINVDKTSTMISALRVPSVRAWLIGAFTSGPPLAQTVNFHPAASSPRDKKKSSRAYAHLIGQVKCFFWQRQDLGVDLLFGFYTPDSCRATLATHLAGMLTDNGPPKGLWSGPTPTSHPHPREGSRRSQRRR